MQQSEQNYFEETYNLIKKYSDDRLLLIKIQATKKTSKLISKLIFIGISAILFFFMLLFISIMLGYYFADLTGSLFSGFGIVAGIYFFIFIFFMLLFKNFISVRIMDMVTNIFFESNDQPDLYEDEEL
jgi:hypothetical protein